MKKILYTVFSALLIAILVVYPAGAGGVKLSSAAFSLGSLITNATATGLGQTDWKFELDASGNASVICINNGSNPAPGQSSPHIDGKGTTDVPRTQISKNGKASFSVTAKPKEEDPTYVLSWQDGGCPNSNWTAKIDFIYWNHAIISAIDPITGIVAATFEYTCVTTRTGPNSTPSTFDDGTVSCTQVN